MEIIKINSIKTYNKFIQDLYKDDPCFKDNKTDIVALLCNPKGAFYSNSRQEMVGVLREGHLQCQAVLIQHKNLPDVLMLALFEARENACAEVAGLISYSKKAAERLGCKKVTVALNGHCNYSIGFLSVGFNEPPAFGQSYNPSYYDDYFTGSGFTPIGYTSYKDDMSSIRAKLSTLAKHGSNKEITYDCRNFAVGRFHKTMGLYTRLNNDIFCGHSYYYKREAGEDLELFEAMRLLLRKDHLIIAWRKNEPVGFILWYPDYNELVVAHGKADYRAFLKYKVLKQIPKTVMVVEIGVYPEYENTGLILALFQELYKLVQKQYPGTRTVASSWIQNENKKSRKLVHYLLRQKNKEFTSYEINL